MIFHVFETTVLQKCFHVEMFLRLSFLKGVSPRIHFFFVLEQQYTRKFSTQNGQVRFVTVRRVFMNPTSTGGKGSCRHGFEKCFPQK